MPQAYWWRPGPSLGQLFVLTLIAFLVFLHPNPNLPTADGAVLPLQSAPAKEGQARFFVPHPVHPRSLSDAEEIPLQSKKKEKSETTKAWLRQHLATKSAYPHADRPYRQLDDVPPGYELAQVQLLCRHGTRFPSRTVSAAFSNLSQKLKETRVPGFEWIRTWSVQDSYPLEKGNLLASRGDADLYMIGRRLRKRYSQFLDKYPYDAALYEIRSSAASRCTQSANAFAMGFFEGRLTKDPRASQWYQEFAIETSKTSKHADDSSLHKKKDSDNPPMILPPIQPVDIYTVPKGLDQELAVKYSCPRWLSVVDNHPLVGQHEKTYIQENIQPIADRLTQLLFPDNGQSDNKQGPVNVNITTKDVQLIYQLCGFEMAFYNDDKTWCQLLWRSPHPRSARTEIASSSSPIDSVEKENDGVAAAIKERGQDFLHLEYLSDLGDYYGYGHGVPFNRHLGRPLAQALIESVDKLLAASSTTEPPETSMSSWYRQTSAASELIDHNSPTNWTFSSPLEGRNLIRPLVDNEDSYPGRLLLDAEDDKETVRRAILKFGHSETIMFWSTFLGLYERPPQSDQSDLTGKSAFRASTFASFAANMVLEVYRPLKKDSGGDGQSVTNNKHKKPETSGGGALVRLLVNEVPHVIPGCDDGDKDQSNSSPVENSHGQSAFCKWSVLRAMLIARGADQDFASCCEMGDHYEVNTPHVISHEKKTIEKECPSTEPLPLAG